MSLSIGIIGLPNAGKSTLFHALTRQEVDVAAYPFTTIDPNHGVVAVPDPRLHEVARIVQPERVVPAAVEFVDIAGLVEGASRGEGLGNQFLAHVRECDALCEVLRTFTTPDVAPASGRVDPLNDAETLQTELCLADLATVEKALPRIRKEATSQKDKRGLLAAAEQAADLLGRGERLWDSGMDEINKRRLAELHLLTLKPHLYVLNVDEELAGSDPEPVKDTTTVALCAQLEAELADLDAEEQREFLSDMGMEEPGLATLARACYDLLGLITFFSTQSEEVRAWPVPEGATAPQAAGTIHSDFERGFIKAEVVSHDDLAELGSEAEARAAGRVRIEGKEYVVRDGDVIRFRFNV